MSKRAISSFMWFAAIWFGYEVVWSMTGVPRPVGPIAAAVVAAFVAVDPLGLFWERPAEAGATGRAESPAVVGLNRGLPTN